MQFDSFRAAATWIDENFDDVETGKLILIGEDGEPIRFQPHASRSPANGWAWDRLCIRGASHHVVVERWSKTRQGNARASYLKIKEVRNA